MISQIRILALLLVAVSARAQDFPAIELLEREEIPIERGKRETAHSLELTLVYLKDTGWQREEILRAVTQAAGIFAQCGVGPGRGELLLVRAPERHRDFFTASAREFVRMLPLSRPAVVFVSGTRQQPAFDAEAIGRGNSRTRPELRDTVWVTRGTRDVGIALAHELAHVLMDSGEHSEEPANLMLPDTAPQNTRLSDGQCQRLRETATSNRLLLRSR